MGLGSETSSPLAFLALPRLKVNLFFEWEFAKIPQMRSVVYKSLSKLKVLFWSVVGGRNLKTVQLARYSAFIVY